MCILSHKVKRVGGIWQLSGPCAFIFLRRHSRLNEMGEFQERRGEVAGRGIL
jgi:hypothetical protein